MIDNILLCEKIKELYPDIGRCGIDVEAEYDPLQKRWVVTLHRNQVQLKTYLENGDAEQCLIGRQCIGLSIEIAQLLGNADARV